VSEAKLFDLAALKWIFTFSGTIGLALTLFWIKPFNSLLAMIFGSAYTFSLVLAVIEGKERKKRNHL
jgi:hypothetical protein